MPCIDSAPCAGSKIRDIVGIGVTRQGKGYAVKVNLGSAADLAAPPQALNGVPMICEVVGAIRRR